MKNIFLFTGKEKFLLDQDLRRWRDGFVEKFGADTIFRFDPEHFDVGRILQSIFGGGLFVEKKMVIIYGAPTDTDPDNKISAANIENFTKEFLPKIQHVPVDVLVAFVSYAPDKRSKLYKQLSENVTVKEYNPLKAPGLKSFVKETIAGYDMGSDVIEYFLVKVGSDLYRIYHECNKLMSWVSLKNRKNITREDVDMVVFGMVDTNVFGIFDVLFSNPREAIRQIELLREEGVDWNQFLGTMYWGMKTFLVILDFLRRGISDSKRIAQEAKLHPFVVSKYLAQKDVLQKKSKEIMAFFHGLLELDASLKTGKWSDALFRMRIKTMVSCFIS